MDLSLKRLEPGHARPEFSCGNGDLDEFYHKDSVVGCNQLLCVMYAIMGNDDIVAFFSLSNDSINKEVNRSVFRRLVKGIPPDKRYRSLPAAKIGRLGVSKKVQSSGIGTYALDFLKYWFTNDNKTGCRFLLVDAYNNERTINFYKNNGFLFLTGKDEKDKTRIMYFDLYTFVNRARKELRKAGRQYL